MCTHWVEMWYNNRRAVIIPGLCPTARRLRGNRLLMGNYTVPLRGHGIICAVQTALPFAAAIRRLPLQSSGLRMLHHSQNQLRWFSCRFAAGKPEWACRCDIITAERLLYTYGQGDTRAMARFRPNGRLYHAALLNVWGGAPC